MKREHAYVGVRPVELGFVGLCKCGMRTLPHESKSAAQLVIVAHIDVERRIVEDGAVRS